MAWVHLRDSVRLHDYTRSMAMPESAEGYEFFSPTHHPLSKGGLLAKLVERGRSGWGRTAGTVRLAL
eukprot:233693-Pleurochrysis_carterae.AAC.5